MSQMSQLGGNTSTPRSRTWFFTFNNYDVSDISNVTSYLEAQCKEYVFQEETGKEGTKHLQGCMRFNNQKRFTEIHNLFPKMHLETCKNWKSAVTYCSKQETCTGERYTNMNLPKPLKDPIKTPYPWQNEILELIKQEPDDRTINWYWEPDGAAGKTSLAKHICINNQNAIFLTGKASDMKYAVAMRVSENKAPEIILMNIVRSQEQFISYQGIEELKDGIFFNSKYESGMVMYNSPHIIIFANFPPDYTKLSRDRWNVVQIGERASASPWEGLVAVQ